VGEGSTFIVRLPALAAVEPAAEAPVNDGTPFPATKPALPAPAPHDPKPGKRDRRRKAG
jgi:hypothetical protein